MHLQDHCEAVLNVPSRDDRVVPSWLPMDDGPLGVKRINDIPRFKARLRKRTH
jgi:hypothetical protein